MVYTINSSKQFHLTTYAPVFVNPSGLLTVRDGTIFFSLVPKPATSCYNWPYIIKPTGASPRSKGGFRNPSDQRKREVNKAIMRGTSWPLPPLWAAVQPSASDPADATYLGVDICRFLWPARCWRWAGSSCRTAASYEKIKDLMSSLMYLGKGKLMKLPRY